MEHITSTSNNQSQNSLQASLQNSLQTWQSFAKSGDPKYYLAYKQSHQPGGTFARGIDH